jgi:hypothetical protein
VSRAAGIRCVLVAIALALGLVPAAAAASPVNFPFSLPAGVPPQLRALVHQRTSPGRSHSPFLSQFKLKTQNGYVVAVLGEGADVGVEVARPHGEAFTLYATRGTVTPHRIEATFGKLGKVAMRFKPSPHQPPARPHRSCHGHHRFVIQRGVYVGELRFTGEDHYISIRSHRRKGGVRRIARQCETRHARRHTQRATSAQRSSGPDAPPRILVASWRHAVDSATFAAFSLFGPVEFLALTAQSEGKLAILRFAFASGDQKALTVDNALTAARVSPPAPFSGAGTYRAAPDGTTTWTGALSVDFLGARRFPLTGPPFKASVDAGF